MMGIGWGRGNATLRRVSVIYNRRHRGNAVETPGNTTGAPWERGIKAMLGKTRNGLSSILLITWTINKKIYCSPSHCADLRIFNIES